MQLFAAPAPTAPLMFDQLAHYPALLTPARAATLLGCSKSVLKSLPLKPIHVRSRGIGMRHHLRYRLPDVLAFRLGGGNGQ